jgi:hypothetical protein
MINIAAVLNAHRVFHRAHPTICKLLHRGVVELAKMGIKTGKQGIKLLDGNEKGMQVWKDQAGKRYSYKKGHREYLD